MTGRRAPRVKVTSHPRPQNLNPKPYSAMIRSHFGLQKNPFDGESPVLLAHQQEVFDILKVHAQQGGL